MHLTENATRRLHWAVKHRLVKAERERFAWLMQAATSGEYPAFRGPVLLRLAVRFQDRRRRDEDNIQQALKNWIDTMRVNDSEPSLGIFLDDSAQNCHVELVVEPGPGPERTIITIEEVQR